ncbi:MAG: zinc ribbon domain-containing protein [Micrococcales bacterium]
MNVTSAQLDSLLELNNIDLQLVTAQKQLLQLSSDSQSQQLQSELTAASAALLDASKSIEAIQLELKRNNDDLALVEQREEKDQSRLLEAKNQKDISGLQNELATLAKRRSDLEDTSLELMDSLSQAEELESKAKSVRSEVQEKLSKQSNATQTEVVKLQSSIALQQQERSRVTGLLSATLIDLYEHKRSRGTAVGLLVGPSCGACRMSISASEYSKLIAKPLDELITCPECSAILVRR